MSSCPHCIGGGQFTKDSITGTAAAEYAADPDSDLTQGFADEEFDLPRDIERITHALELKLYRTKWWACYYSDGTISKVPAATMGNRTYAHNRQDRIDTAVNHLLNAEKFSLLWLTLTHKYENDDAGRRESWLWVHRSLPKFLRALRSLGMTSYIAVKEAHALGGCHVHIASRWNRKFEGFEDDSGKLRITDETFRQTIKQLWQGHLDIQIVKDKMIGGYLSKEMGKHSHIEDSLKRAKRNWQGPNDEKQKTRDMKKLYGIYYASTLHIRMITTSRDLPAVEPPEGEVGEFILSKNNTTGRILEEVIEIPPSLKIYFKFDISTGDIDPESELYGVLERLRYRPPPIGTQNLLQEALS
jgi:hypothetical protein